jgi:hypothetical protein
LFAFNFFFRTVGSFLNSILNIWSDLLFLIWSGTSHCPYALLITNLLSLFYKNHLNLNFFFKSHFHKIRIADSWSAKPKLKKREKKVKKKSIWVLNVYINLNSDCRLKSGISKNGLHNLNIKKFFNFNIFFWMSDLKLAYFIKIFSFWRYISTNFHISIIFENWYWFLITFFWIFKLNLFDKKIHQNLLIWYMILNM